MNFLHAVILFIELFIIYGEKKIIITGNGGKGSVFNRLTSASPEKYVYTHFS